MGGLSQQKFISHSSGVQKSEIKVLAGLVLSGGFEGESAPGLSASFWWWPAILGLP